MKTGRPKQEFTTAQLTAFDNAVMAGKSQKEILDTFGLTHFVYKRLEAARDWKSIKGKAKVLEKQQEARTCEEKKPVFQPPTKPEPPKREVPEVLENQHLTLPSSIKDAQVLEAEHEAALSSYFAKLNSLTDASPEDFQSGFAKVAQAAIALGLPQIPPPRNMRELQTLVTLWRQTSGLADKAKDGKGGFLSPIGPVRRGRVVEADPVDPTEGFTV